MSKWTAGAIGKSPQDDKLVWRDDAVSGQQFYAATIADAEYATQLLNDLEGLVFQFSEERQQATDRAEQAEVQLAGCGVAALGWNENPVQPGDYGWSASYGDVLKLRRLYEIAMRALREIAMEGEWSMEPASQSIARKALAEIKERS